MRGKSRSVQKIPAVIPRLDHRIVTAMTLMPLAADVWEQALVNGRTVNPTDDKAALAWAKDWYAKQGGTFANADGVVVELQQEAPAVAPELAAEPEPEPAAEKPKRSRQRHHRPAEETAEPAPEA